MTIKFGSPEAQAVLKADRELAYERRQEIVGTIACACGSEVELWAETEEWTQADDGETWQHADFGPGFGECDNCGALYTEGMYGDVLQLVAPKTETAIGA